MEPNGTAPTGRAARYKYQPDVLRLAVIAMMDETMRDEVIEYECDRLGLTSADERARYRTKFCEVFDVYDAASERIGREWRGICHLLGLWHRTVHILLFAPDDCVLLQRRNERPYVDSHPGRLDISIGGHCGSGRTVVAAAIAEAREEAGLTLAAERLHEVLTYPAVSLALLDQPRFANREHISLFTCGLSIDECEALDRTFGDRTGPDREVVGIEWHDHRSVLAIIATGRAAGGLVGSYAQYIAHSDRVRRRHKAG